MFTQQRAMFIYAVSPLHMGAGTALGLIDNPIQREVHTDWPSIAGSGIKGAIRHGLRDQEGWKNGKLTAVFGPETGASELHAGAVSFSDAHVVCFPVRSMKNAYVYASCPTALARLKRLTGASWLVPIVAESDALLSNDQLLQDGRLVLETLAYNGRVDERVVPISTWLAEHALSEEFFANKLKADLVLLSDTDFTHFVRNATLVEPHVRIDESTGTAAAKGLFYTENLPPETLLVSLLMASATRGGTSMDAEHVASDIANALSGSSAWQFGGDSTTGRGLVSLRLISTGATR